jgi:hypothetical protein
MEGRIWEGVVRDYVQEGGTYCDGSVEHATQGDVRAAVPRSMLGVFLTRLSDSGSSDALNEPSMSSIAIDTRRLTTSLDKSKMGKVQWTDGLSNDSVRP